jgi:ABC-type sugar transport system, periplasmic component
MRKKKAIIGIVILIIIFLLLIFYQATKPQKIIIRFGMFTGSNWNVASADSFKIIDKAIEKFEMENPNVEVIYEGGIAKEDYSEWLSARFLEGTMPDVFMIKSTDFEKFSSLQAMKNLDLLIEQDADFVKEDFFSAALGVGVYEKGQYALPYETVPTLLFVNKTLLESEQIEMPNEEWTWEEMYEICAQVTKDIDGDGVIDQFGTYNYNWLNALYSNGGTLIEESNGKLNLTTKNVLSAISYVKDIHSLNEGYKVTQEDFNQGKVAFMPLTFAEYRTYKTYPYRVKKYLSFQWDCITFPAGVAGENTSEVDALLIGINEKTKHEELAWKFLKMLTSDEEVQMDIFRDSQGVSVLKKVTQSKEAENIIKENMDDNEQVINTMLLSNIIEGGVNTPKTQEYDQIIRLADSEIMRIIEENKNIESTMKIFQRNIESTHFLEQME